jgi:cell division GTPase FtsZ
MPSKAYENLGHRMKDIEQLIQAHIVITQFKRARKTAEKAGGGLEKIAEVIDSLISAPGKGRRSEVDALNRAAIVLLSAHLQGYIEDVYSESAKALLNPNVADIEALIKQGLSSFSNPHAYRIDRLFASIGLSRITDGLSWQKASNKSVKQRLTDYIQVRNDIAHGKQSSVHKAKVVQFKQFVEVLARCFDEKLENEIVLVTKKQPW